MRIIVHDYAGHAFPISLSRALAARGHEVVHAFASSLQTPRGDLLRKSDDSPTLEFREIPMNPDYPRFKYSFRRRRTMEIRYGQEVAKFIAAWKPDAVLSGNTPTETQEPITRATRAAGARFYYWVQDFYSLAVEQILRRKFPLVGAWIGWWYRHLDRLQFQRSSKIIAITKDFIPVLTQEFGVDPDDVAVVPNWALIEEIPVLSKDNPWSRQHGLHNKFVYLYSGTIGMKHNPAMLLELARRHSTDRDVRVVIVSEGMGADWLRKEAESAGLSNLIIFSYQPFQELAAVLASGDVLVGILEEEAGMYSVPSKTLTYLCAGRPLLLAMPLENLAARITRDNHAGLVVAPGDLAGFLNAATTLHGAANLRAEFSGNARAYAEATFPIAKTAAVFEQILASHPQ